MTVLRLKPHDQQPEPNPLTAWLDAEGFVGERRARPSGNSFYRTISDGERTLTVVTTMAKGPGAFGITDVRTELHFDDVALATLIRLACAEVFE
jgi:hypothetical protein